VPVDRWLRHELRDWGEALLSPHRLDESGVFNASEVRKLWAEHQSGRRNWDMGLWSVLMFQAWREAQDPAHRPAETPTQSTTAVAAAG
jgi:asparagine synthase (glutamine-hydrolysing)